MSEVNIFEQASRENIRFKTNKGAVPVEVLWQLPLTTMSGETSLDSLYKQLNKQVGTVEESLIVRTTEVDKQLLLQLALVKHVTLVRLAEAKSRTQEKERAEMKQEYLQLLAEKEQAEKRELSKDELLAALDKLDK